MEDLWAGAWPFLLIALLPGAALLAAPGRGVPGRTTIAAGFALGAALLVLDVLLFDHSAPASLAVTNLFPSPPNGAARQWIVAESTAPLWAWHVFVAAVLATVAALLWVRRRRPPGPPPPLLYCAAVFWFYLLLRLGLERFAAHPNLVWAVGGTPALLVILPFFASWCGRAGMTFGRFALALLWLGWVQRLPLIAFAWLATTQQFGTHLDTHRVTELWLPLGSMTFGDDAVLGWIWLTLLPHLTLWPAITVVAGVVLGVLPWWNARRVTSSAG